MWQSTGPLNHFRAPGRITEAFHSLDANSVNHAEEKVSGGLSTNFYVAPGPQGAPSAAGEDHRQVRMGVAVAVGIPAPVDNHRIMEQRIAIDIFGLFHFLKKSCELLHVPQINLCNLVHHVLFVSMMRQEVMSFRNCNLREGAVAAFIGEKESGDAGGIGLKRQNHHVIHNLDVFFKAGRNARGRFQSGIRAGPKLFGLFESLFNLPHAAPDIRRASAYLVRQAAFARRAHHPARNPGSSAVALGGA